LQYDSSISIIDIDIILTFILDDFIVDTLVLLLLLFFEKDDWGWNITIYVVLISVWYLLTLLLKSKKKLYVKRRQYVQPLKNYTTYYRRFLSYDLLIAVESLSYPKGYPYHTESW